MKAAISGAKRAVLAAVVAASFANAGTVLAAEKIVIARSGIDIAFAPMEIGQEAKIWQALDLDIQIVEIPGTRIEQVLMSGDADVGLGAGIALGVRMKGVPTIGVAAIAGAPYNFTLIVPTKSPIRAVADLKGKSVSVTTAGSVTEWMVRELSRQQGWGPNGIKAAPLGDESARMAALRTGGVDANLSSLMQSFDVEDRGEARILVYFGDVVKEFQTLAMKSSDRFVNEHPERLERFLKGWFRSVAYMKSHKDVSVSVVSKTFKIDAVAVAKAYDVEMKMMSDDGVFSVAGMDVVRHSLVEMGILDKMPEAHELYTDRFVPVK